MKKIKQIFFYCAIALIIFPTYVFAQDLVIPNADIVVPKAGPDGKIVDILQNLLQWLLQIVGILGVISFVIAGIIYLTSAGDEKQIQRGKKALVYSIVGIIVALMGVVIMQAVNALLSGNSSNF